MARAKAKAKAKAKANPTWTTEGEVFLLNWLDDNKGPEGELHKDEETVFNRLVGDEKFVAQHPSVEGRPTDEEKRQVIHRKLKWFWNNYRLPEYSEAPYTKTTIYDKGTAVFDWQRLEGRYPHLYTPEQFQVRKELAGIDTSFTRQNGTKRKAQENQSPNGGPADIPSQKRQRSQRDNTPRQDATESSAQTGQTNNAESGQNQTPRLRQTLRQKPLDRDERRVRQNAMLSDLDFIKLPKFQRLLGNSWNDNTELTDRDRVAIELVRIYDAMKNAVSDYMIACEVDDYQPVVLEPKSAYPRQLNYLIALILGGLAYSVDDRRELFQHLQRENAITYGFFIRSLLAAAVTDWALETHLAEEEIYRSYGGGLVQQVLESSLDPVVEARLREKFLESYVDREFKPLIGSKAKDMASKFQTFVDLLLPRLSVQSLVQETKGVESCPRTDPGDRGTATNPPDLFEEPIARINFRQDLFSVFEKALQWRAEREKKMFEHYCFSFPSLGDGYVTANMMQEVDSEGNHRERAVVLCLFPVTFRTVQRKLLGSSTDPEKVANGVVV